MAVNTAYQMAPHMLVQMPAAFQAWKTKSPNATAPTTVITTFFMLPATLVVRGSFFCVQTYLQAWDTVSERVEMGWSAYLYSCAHVTCRERTPLDVQTPFCETKEKDARAVIDDDAH